MVQMGMLVVMGAAAVINPPPDGPSLFPLTLFYVKINNKIKTI